MQEGWYRPGESRRDEDVKHETNVVDRIGTGPGHKRLQGVCGGARGAT